MQPISRAIRFVILRVPQPTDIDCGKYFKLAPPRVELPTRGGFFGSSPRRPNSLSLFLDSARPRRPCQRRAQCGVDACISGADIARHSTKIIYGQIKGETNHGLE
jgi:hypothetical protein